MTEQLKVAILLSTALLVAVAMWIYFSPYQSCVRAHRPIIAESHARAAYCGSVNSGGVR